MWDPEHFPGADNVPWPLLIRARFQHEVDAILASTIVANLAGRVGDQLARQLAVAGAQGVAASLREPTRSKARSGEFVNLLAEWDDWCGTKWPRWPFPWPGPRPGSELLDPAAVVLASKAIRLVELAGGPGLNEQLGSTLGEIAGGMIGG